MNLINTNPETISKIQGLGHYFLTECGKLPKGRFVKLFYLLDWKSTLSTGKTVTGLVWYYNHYGPFLPELVNTLLQNSSDIKISSEVNSYGEQGDYISLSSGCEAKDYKNLSEEEKNLANEVIAATKVLNFTQFIKLVYSTYPVRSSQKYSELNLVKLAKLYQDQA